MFRTALSIFVLVLAGIFFSCGPKVTEAEKDYDQWLAKHDSSVQYHKLIYEKHQVMCSNHDELMGYIEKEIDLDEELLADLEEHSQFYFEHENILNHHREIIEAHKEIMEKFKAGEYTDEEFDAKLVEIMHDHEHMDEDHEYIKNKTLRIRSEHNDMRRRYNAILEERR